MDEHPTDGKRARYTREQIEEALAAYEVSGISQKKFCADRGLSLATFGNWRRKYGKAEARAKAMSGFCEVRLKEGHPGESTVIRLCDGTEVILAGVLSPVRVAEYVAALGRSC
jgi:transposase-like protein